MRWVMATQGPGKPLRITPDVSASLYALCVAKSMKGHPLTVGEIARIASTYYDVVVDQNSLPISKRTVLRWLRNVDLKNMFGCVMTPARAKVMTTGQWKAFYESIVEIATYYGLTPQEMGARMINWDETAAITHGNGKKSKRKYVWARHHKRALRRNTRRNVQHITFGHFIHHTGVVGPTVAVFPQVSPKTEQKWKSNNGLPADTMYFKSQEGSVCGDMFLEIVQKCLIPYLDRVRGTTEEARSQRWFLLVDGCSAHFPPGLIQALDEVNVSFIVLPPNCTHLFQPLDVGVFGVLKNKFYSILRTVDAQVRQFKRNVRLSRDLQVQISMGWQVMRSYAQAAKEALSPALCASAFAKCGLFPFKPEMTLVAINEEVEVKLQAFNAMGQMLQGATLYGDEDNDVAPAAAAGPVPANTAAMDVAPAAAASPVPANTAAMDVAVTAGPPEGSLKHSLRCFVQDGVFRALENAIVQVVPQSGPVDSSLDRTDEETAVATRKAALLAKIGDKDACIEYLIAHCLKSRARLRVEMENAHKRRRDFTFAFLAKNKDGLWDDADENEIDYLGCVDNSSEFGKAGKRNEAIAAAKKKAKLRAIEEGRELMYSVFRRCGYGSAGKKMTLRQDYSKKYLQNYAGYDAGRVGAMEKVELHSLALMEMQKRLRQPRTTGARRRNAHATGVGDTAQQGPAAQEEGAGDCEAASARRHTAGPSAPPPIVRERRPRRAITQPRRFDGDVVFRGTGVVPVEGDNDFNLDL